MRWIAYRDKCAEFKPDIVDGYFHQLWTTDESVEYADEDGNLHECHLVLETYLREDDRTMENAYGKVSIVRTIVFDIGVVDEKGGRHFSYHRRQALADAYNGRIEVNSPFCKIMPYGMTYSQTMGIFHKVCSTSHMVYDPNSDMIGTWVLEIREYVATLIMMPIHRDRYDVPTDTLDDAKILYVDCKSNRDSLNMKRGMVSLNEDAIKKNKETIEESIRMTRYLESRICELKEENERICERCADALNELEKKYGIRVPEDFNPLDFSYTGVYDGGVDGLKAAVAAGYMVMDGDERTTALISSYERKIESMESLRQMAEDTNRDLLRENGILRADIEELVKGKPPLH